MSDATREAQLLETFATLADTLVAGYDVVELLQILIESCQQNLAVDAAGILLADQDGDAEVVVSTSEASRLVELIHLSVDVGPGMDSLAHGKAVQLADVTEGPAKWARFSTAARSEGFQSAITIPLRLREETIGVMSLLRERRGLFPAEDVRAAQALADVATIGILHERVLRESNAVRDQLQQALDSRIVIEQAKGVLAYTHHVSLDQAFVLLRAHARSHSLGLSDVARRVVRLELTI